MTERMVEDPRAEMLRLELRLQQIQALERASSSFLSFAKYMWPEAILSAHHQKMASAFDRSFVVSVLPVPAGPAGAPPRFMWMAPIRVR